MTSLSVDVNAMQRASVVQVRDSHSSCQIWTSFQRWFCILFLWQRYQRLRHLPVSRSYSSRADYVTVLQRTLEYKKFGLLHVYHAYLSVIFTLTALTGAMFVITILGSDRRCPFMQEDVKMWLF